MGSGLTEQEKPFHEGSDSTLTSLTCELGYNELNISKKNLQKGEARCFTELTVLIFKLRGNSERNSIKNELRALRMAASIWSNI